MNSTRLSTKKFFLISFIVFTVALIPLFRADINYIDDNGRVMYGYRSWNNFGRYLSNIFSIIIHCNKYLSDISPLPQIIAVLFIICATIIVIKITEIDSNNKHGFSYCMIFIIPILGLNPYFLECLSFKFDAPYMALSVLASVIPFLFISKIIHYSVASFVCTLIVCTTYQVSLAGYVLCSIFLFVLFWSRGIRIKKLFLTFISGFVAFLLALLFFKICLMPETHGYVENSFASIHQVEVNYKKYLTNIIKDFPIQWIVSIFLLMIFFLYTFTVQNRHKKLLAFTIAIVTLLLMFISSFGFYPFLEKPIFRCRAMYGIGICLALYSAYLCSLKKFYFKIPVILLGWIFFVFSHVYGNSLNIQKNYTEFRVGLALNDLNKIDDFINTNIKKTLFSNNNYGKAPILKKSMELYPVLNRMVSSTIFITGNANSFSRYAIINHYGIKNISYKKLNQSDLYPVIDTMYHKILRNNQHSYFIYFK